MSDIRFNRWLHQSGTGGVSQDSSGNIGIGTTVPTKALDVRGDVNIGNTININNASGIISATTFTGTTGTFSGNVSAVDATFTGNVTIGGTLTYEDVANIDAVGIITAQSDIIVGGGLTVTGISTFNNDVKLLDNDQLKFGIGEDLQIYHDSTSGKSHIKESGPGLLQVDTNNFSIRNSQDTEQLAYFTENAGVGLYYNNSKKLETTNTGAVVTGILTATTFSGNLTGNVTGDLTGNLAGTSTIAAISSSISDTANDVFVYDTRKDSDGGAWRKRTQHTSWYNETLNTSTRGSRKEFPAVAVIVSDVSSDKVTIYDGDDPNLPMWMVISGANPRGILGWATTNITSIKVTALNGILVLGTNDSGTIFKFVEDFVEIMYSSANYNITSSRTIAGRNDARTYDTVSGTASRVFVIATYIINDVAMTVLPNAPIDDATGLPVPTIAVATGGGVSVIKDDGTVVDSGFTGSVNYLSFSESGDRLFVSRDDSKVFTSSNTSYISADGWGNDNEYYRKDASNTAYFPWINEDSSGPSLSRKNVRNVYGSQYGITVIDETPGVRETGMGAWIASDYNTGWMQGDIKGAFLSDTDTTNVTGGGDGLITGNDSTFGDTIANLNWSERSGSGGAWNVSGGVLKTGTVSSGEYLDITTSGYTSGQTYVISYTLANVTGSNPIRWRFNDGQMGALPTSNGSHSYYVTLTETGTLFSLLNDANLTADIDNFKLQLVQEEDRSVNNKGLTAYGTVTKSAVATGADLVAYSGWGDSNYLLQPYNSDMDFSSDFYIKFWAKTTDFSTSNQYIIFRSSHLSNTTPKLEVFLDPATGIGMYIHDGSSGSNVTAANSNWTSGVWTCITMVRSGSTGIIYVNGKNVGTGTLPTGAVGSSSSGMLQIGGRAASSGYYYRGSLSLLRMGSGLPSPVQIKKIYEDEKHLFKENAKATLYGSSDAVTALGYDEDTELLHVGTSSGRSDFQGLRRINNTTTAVTTAISASDDLIAEQ